MPHGSNTALACLGQECEGATLELAASTEVDLAITFCKVAATPNDQARSDRIIAAAEEAYASATYYLGRDLNSIQDSRIRDKLTRLESLLAGFGRGILRNLPD